jgi:hypothetical protein
MKRKLLLLALAAVLTAFAAALVSCDNNFTSGEDDPPDGETETVSEELLDIDINAVNKNEALFSGVENPYLDNPLLGAVWKMQAGGGFVYVFKTDGTVSSTHHCGLVFPNQFSYVMYKNWLVLCGSEMESDRLEIWSVHRPPEAEAEGALVFFGRDEAGALTGYDVFVQSGIDGNPDNAGADVTPPYALFAGKWNGADGATYEFFANGTYTVTSGGTTAEYSYLARGNTFITLTRGETEMNADGGEVWKVKPEVTRTAFTFTSGSSALILGGAALTRLED